MSKYLRGATFIYGGHDHVAIKPARRYRQDGYVICRLHEGERIGYPYWVAASSLPEEVRDACTAGRKTK